MSHINISPDLFLEKLELNRFQEFLGDQGHKRLLKQMTFTPGLVKFHEQNEFLNGLIQEDSPFQDGTKTLKSLEIKGFDLFGNFIHRPLSRQIAIPQRNTWYWVKVKYDTTTLEDGLFSIDASGGLISTEADLMTIFRGQPNFPTKIKFENSDNNIYEYEVLEVIDSNHAILNGYFIAEGNLKLSIVGTFTPGVVKSEADKYPFRKDYSDLTLVEEVLLNKKPNHVVGEEFFLARVRWSDNQVIIQDKRVDIWKTNAEFLAENTQEKQNKIFGIESIKFNHENSFQEENIIELAWNIRTSNWTINSNSNTLTIYSKSLGGRFKSIKDFVDGDFNGFIVFTENGKKSKIVSSIKEGDVVNLKLDVLDISNYTISGGLDLLEQEILICPNENQIEINFYSQINKNYNYSFVYKINQKSVQIKLPIYNTPTSSYSLRYRYVSGSLYSNWFVPLSDEIGYLSEVNFDVFLNLNQEKEPTYTPYTPTIDLDWISLNAPSKGIKYYKELLNKNSNDTEQFIIPSNDIVKILKSGLDKTNQLILNSSCLSNVANRQFLNLDLDSVLQGSGFMLFLGPEVVIGTKELVITQGYETNKTEGKIIKVITDRDFRVARDLKTCISINLLFTGVSWICSPNYYLSPKLELTLYHGSTSDTTCFDSTGLGIGNGWEGSAICNGNNGAPNITSAPAGSVYVKRIY